MPRRPSTLAFVFAVALLFVVVLWMRSHVIFDEVSITPANRKTIFATSRGRLAVLILNGPGKTSPAFRYTDKEPIDLSDAQWYRPDRFTSTDGELFTVPLALPVLLLLPILLLAAPPALWPRRGHPPRQGFPIIPMPV